MTRKKKSNGKTTIVSFLLDETGSMHPILDDTIGGFNSYIDTLGKSKNPIVFSLVKFDSSKIEKVHTGVPIKKVPHLTHETYKPGAMTPLVDASVKIIHATEQALKRRDDKPNVLIVIQTDGFENASTEFTFPDLTKLIREKEKEGWTFLYIGAGVDAYDTAVTKMGLSVDHTMSYDRKSSAQAFACLATNTESFAASGLACDAGFNAAQKADLAVSSFCLRALSDFSFRRS